MNVLFCIVIGIVILSVVGCMSDKCKNDNYLSGNHSSGFVSEDEKIKTLRGAQDGNVSDMLRLADYYIYGVYVPNEGKALYWYDQARKRGSSKGQLAYDTLKEK